MLKKYKQCLLCFIVLFGVVPVKVVSQSLIDPALKSTFLSLKSIKERLPIEKLYVQLDKPYYVSGDTLRFKAYLFNADYFTPSVQSGLLYVELDGLDNKPVKKMMVPVSLGLGWGDIALDEKGIPQGTYTLRAYTNWMRNFEEDYIFKQQINISSITSSTLVKTNFKLYQQADKQNAEALLQFTELDGRIQPLKEMELKVMDGNHNLSKDKVTTAVDGTLKVNFNVPEKININNLYLKLRQTGKTGELTIPINITRPENTDLQFMPEGGNLIAGIKTKIGFKAIAEDGKGINVSGKIIDSRQQEIAVIKTTHSGMGNFEFIPKAGETYTAKINGITKTYALPIVNQNGTALRIEEDTDSLRVTITSTTGAKDIYYLIGQSRGVVCYAEQLSFKDNADKRIISKSLFPTGIARFTLLNADHKPLNERIVFINHHDEFQISVYTNKKQYTIRDSIALGIQVKDKTGKPLQGSFSLSVTDDNQVKVDSTGSNILNNLLLTSDLKGTVEDPGYYFQDDNKEQDLDNLLLTQGWVGYNWQDVFYPQTDRTEFAAEKEFIVKGTVTNAFGKPIEKSKIALLANHPLLFKDTVSDKYGQFVFSGIFPVDTALFKLQARNKNGNDNNVRINAEGVKPPVFTPAKNITPWYVNSDTSLLMNAKTHIAELKAISKYNGEGKMLKEVNINERKIVPGSKNLNGPGEADQILDEKDMEKADKMTLGILLEQKIKGFFVNGLWSFFTIQGGHGTRPLPYTLYSRKIRFVFDGIDLDFFYTSKDNVDRYNYIKSFLDYYTAEDITGIEIMSSAKYNANYHAALASTSQEFVNVTADSYAFIEITTRAKQGPFMKVTPGTYLYKTLAFTLPKQFYRPRYTIKSRAAGIGTDLRSTIHWEPNIITDKYGKAYVLFFSADKSGSYTVTIEGTDMNGNIGRQISKIKVD